MRYAHWALPLAALVALAAPLMADGGEAVEDEGWIKVFNGEDLEGWMETGEADWSVEDGILIGKQGEGMTPGDLWTEEVFGDFEAVVTFRVVWPANSGVWFRSSPPDNVGYQVDILDLATYGCTVGTIYCEGFLSQNKDESIVNMDGWNTFRMSAKGYHFTVELNDHLVADVDDEEERFPEGRLGLQVHAGDQYKDMRIMIREFRVRPLAE